MYEAKSIVFYLQRETCFIDESKRRTICGFMLLLRLAFFRLSHVKEVLSNTASLRLVPEVCELLLTQYFLPIFFINIIYNTMMRINEYYFYSSDEIHIT
jgi:hypothetical protein